MMKTKLTLIAGIAVLVIGAPMTLTAQSREGIRVHGEWTIDIRNADGSLAAHHEFKNALTASGQELLAQVIVGERSLGAWRVGLLAPGGVASPCGMNQPCEILEPGAPADQPYIFPNLTRSRSGSTLVLSGTATAVQGGQVTAVFTSVEHCASLPCAAGSPGQQVTARALDAALPITQGQIIQVKVVISFS